MSFSFLCCFLFHGCYGDDERYHAVFGPSLDQQLAELRSGNVVAAKARSSNEKEILFADKNYESSASVHVCNSISIFKM